jgi:hypothetical protein
MNSIEKLDPEHIIISYFPLCGAFKPDGNAIINAPSVGYIKGLYQAVTDSADVAHAKGCLWVVDDTVDGSSGFAPVFITTNAEAIYNDLCEWSENNHSKWFTLDWAVHDDRYAIVVMPKLEESVRRYKLRLLIEQEDLSQSNITILFQPLQFGSKPILETKLPNSIIDVSDMSEFKDLSEEDRQKVMELCAHNITTTISKRLPAGSKQRIGLIDQAEVDEENMQIATEPFWIGPLDVVPCSENAMKSL